MQPTRLQIGIWLLPVSRRSESSRHPLAVNSRSCGLTGSYSGPEVRFEDIASDLHEPRFWTAPPRTEGRWITSGWPTTQDQHRQEDLLSDCLDSSGRLRSVRCGSAFAMACFRGEMPQLTHSLLLRLAAPATTPHRRDTLT